MRIPAKAHVLRAQGSMSPTDATRGTSGPTAAPRRVFLSHTSDLGKPDEKGSFVAAAVAASSEPGTP